MEKTKNSRLKKVVLAATSVLAVASVTAGLTVAILSDTDSKTNTFPGSPAIKLQLNEPLWDGYTNGQGDGTTVNPAAQNKEDLGLTIAGNYQPGSVIPKNPALTNTSDNATVENEYMAMKVEYQVQESTGGEFVTITAQQFARLASINFNTSAWTKTATDASGADYYCYGTANTLTNVAKGATTTPLFTEVTVTKNSEFVMSSTDETTYDLGGGKTITWDANTLPQFKILVYGSAIQADNNTDTYANNTAALQALFS
ncbi:MAG: hypothetical protein U0M23_10185 [Acutalibacteraceae bacterium]|nr:hypothetical protein [Acutalibacteraceae bacterium]HIR02919.1 hypothetical protein [Candidatus Scatovicinus merdipullorum]